MGSKLHLVIQGAPTVKTHQFSQKVTLHYPQREKYHSKVFENSNTGTLKL